MSLLGKRAVSTVDAVAKTKGLSVESIVAKDKEKSVVAVRIPSSDMTINFVVRHGQTEMRPTYFAQFEKELHDFMSVRGSWFGEFAEQVAEELRRIA